MRLQTMYVDMRPVIIKWLGFMVVLVFATAFVGSVQPDLMRATTKVQAAYQQASQGGHFNFGSWDSCLRSSECLGSFLVTWSAPTVVKAFILGGLVFGVVAAAFGMLWRPEVVAMRDTRINAVKVDESRLKSPTAPRGLL